MTKEQKFYNSLQDIFIGAKIEGQGGFVNLMKIKSNYYSKIEKILKEDIEKALNQYPTFREELFDKLYTFFNRYFTESGSIYFNSTPFHNNIYEKVYTDDKDVILFWKTQMLYYVKTDRIFKSIPVEFDNYKFYFDASTIENKKANEKRSLIYELKEVKEDKTIIFNVYYSEKGRVTKTEDILKELKKKEIKLDEETLERAFRIFERQSEVDFFINKNAKAFLQEQFKLWSYQYFWEGAKEWSADRVNELQILKDIAFKIIDFISQFEDELVKIWNKPKFVKNSNYVITLDRIKDIHVVEKILNHQSIQEQIKEWQELGIVEESFDKNKIIENDVFGKKVNAKFQFLPIDTKYFKDLEFEILNLFDDLDKSLDGWLIKSENYQALNTILPKFKEKVQTIYIDPPFNLDSSDQFLYRTNYKDANWATLLENRLRIAREWLNERGSIFVRCDYNGNWIVRCLMDDIFDGNFINEIAVGKTAGKKKTGLSLSYTKDNLFFYAKNPEYIINETIKETYDYSFYKKIIKILEKNNFNNKNKLSDILLNNLFWVDLDHRPGERQTNKSRKLLGIEFSPPKGRHWIKSQEKLDQLYKEGKARLKDKVTEKIYYKESELNSLKNNDNLIIQVFLDNEIITDNWTDINGYSQASGFQTENSEIVLKRSIETASNKTDLILDFFLGSGTTIAVAHKLGRKWIGVEMGEHFYSVVLPRMKKVLFYDKSGISKEVKEYQGGGFFKYYELEQYEETLANTVYENYDLFIIGDKSPYEQYVFMKDEKMLRAFEIDYENKKVNVDLSKLYQNIDIAETLSNLTGKWIKKITQNQVEFPDGSIVNIKDLDYKSIKQLIWWE
ncbi:MAG: site-specific DNA-methyltransferase [Bacteroidales bacterium]|nr:site-specific DNA-methyltransferase [Bacteroidales bacterium]